MVFMRINLGSGGAAVVGMVNQSAMAGTAGSLVEPLNLLVVLVTLLFASGLSASVIVYIGTRARNMKEAGGYIMPLSGVVTFAALVTMTMDSTSNLALFLVPLINLVFVFKAAIVGALIPASVALTLLVNVCFMFVFVWLTIREFNSERVLYTE
jgi:sodium transport system permease protein